MLGATVNDGRVTFQLWAPNAVRVQLELYLAGGTQQHELVPDPSTAGMFIADLADVPAGSLYKYRLDGGDAFPDPCSRFQPQGVHGPSAVVDAAAFAWSDGGWQGLRADGLSIYELHTGTFTPAGTFDAASERLEHLRDLGVGAIELLPVAEFPGRWNWGYDGVALYAPSRVYGGPEALRRLVDAAHARGIGVLLDVVYNHLGPDGNYLRVYSPYYFTDRYQTPWGEAINYDGEHAAPVREYVLQNAEHWIREYHIDGLRLDATHAIEDSSEPHLLRELSQRTRRAAGTRGIVLIAENDANDVRLVTPERGGYGLDAVWADDFHHALHATLTGEQEGYYEDYVSVGITGAPATAAGNAASGASAANQSGVAAIARAVRDGFLYQGQPSRHLGRARGTRVTSEPASAFVFCLQNHDQIGNRALGERLHQLVPIDLCRVATAVLLFAPETPLLFMGQEFAASAPFQYFTDHTAELGRLVTEGRRAEFGRFAAFRDESLRSRIPDPQAASTFTTSKLNWSEATPNAANPGNGGNTAHTGMLALHRDLLALRRTDPVLSRRDRQATAAVAIGDHLLLVARKAGNAVRLLIANFGHARTPPSADMLNSISVPPVSSQSVVIFSTTDNAYLAAGEQTNALMFPQGAIQSGAFQVPPHTAVIMEWPGR